MGRPLAALALALLATVALPAARPAAAPAHPIAFERYAVAVDGQVAYGWLAYPTDAAPTTLLVIAHGCCLASGVWTSANPATQDANLNGTHRMAHWAADLGAAVVGMDYRGDGRWNVWAGHRDTIAAAQDLKARWNITRTVLWGLSMGGEVSGMAVAARPDLFDYWVDEYGVTNLAEEFPFIAPVTPGPSLQSPASGTATLTQSWVLAETGGPPGADPQAWSVRSPALRGAEMAGLKRAYVLHGVGDPIVPASQSLEMFAALRSQRIPASLVLVTSNQDACPHCGAQAPAYLQQTCLAAPAPLPRSLCLPGSPIGLAAHGAWVQTPTLWLLGALLSGAVPHAAYPSLVEVLDYSADNVAGPNPARYGDHEEIDLPGP